MVKHNTTVKTEKKIIYCPYCKNPNEINDELILCKWLSCSKCEKIIRNPSIPPAKFSSTIKSCNLERHGIKLLIGGIILFIIITLLFKLRQPEVYSNIKSQTNDEADQRIDKLKSQVKYIFNQNKGCKECLISLSKLKAAEESFHGDLDVTLTTYPLILPDGGMLIYSSKFLIASPKENAKKDIVHGLPIDFSYRFIFNEQDSLIKKVILVNYDKDTAVEYDFNFPVLKNLVNVVFMSKKIKKWTEDGIKLEKQRIKETNESNRRQIESQKNKCQEERKLIKNLYRIMMNNLNELEYQYKNMPYEEFGSDLTEWIQEADNFQKKYHKTDFECFFWFDYSAMLSSYDQAVRDFDKVYLHQDYEDYYIFKNRVKEKYLLLMEGYKNQ